MEVWCKDRAKSRRDLEEYLGECANLGTGRTDLVRTLYGPYGSVRTETSRKFTSQPFEHIWSWCKNRALVKLLREEDKGEAGE